MYNLKCSFMALMIAIAGPVTALADIYPARTVKVIVPWPAGGVADVLARMVSDTLSRELGQIVIVDNRPGAGTNIGSELVAKAEPDGYTLLLAGTSNTVNMTLYKSVRYDIIKDFEPISKLALTPLVLVANSGVKAKTVKELIDYAKANPGKLKLATSGNGSPSHLVGEKLKQVAQIDMVIVPFKGAAPAVIDLIGGFVDITFTNIPTSVGAIKAGQLRPIAIGSTSRSPILPDVPTMTEAGLPDLEATGWWGLMAPKGTPKPVIEKISAAIQKMKTPEIEQKLVKIGAEPVWSTPDVLAAVVKSDVDAYRDLIQKMGIQVE